MILQIMVLQFGSIQAETWETHLLYILLLYLVIVYIAFFCKKTKTAVAPKCEPHLQTLQLMQAGEYREAFYFALKNIIPCFYPYLSEEWHKFYLLTKRNIYLAHLLSEIQEVLQLPQPISNKIDSLKEALNRQMEVLQIIEGDPLRYRSTPLRQEMENQCMTILSIRGDIECILQFLNPNKLIMKEPSKLDRVLNKLLKPVFKPLISQMKKHPQFQGSIIDLLPDKIMLLRSSHFYADPSTALRIPKADSSTQHLLHTVDKKDEEEEEKEENIS